MVDAELPVDFQVVEVPKSEGEVNDPSRTVAGLTPEQYPDVFDRIREGFKLEDVESRQIDLRAWTETRPLADGQAGFEKIAYAPGSTLKMVFEV